MIQEGVSKLAHPLSLSPSTGPMIRRQVFTFIIPQFIKKELSLW